MNTLKITNKGLLIPLTYLDGLPETLHIRRIKDGLVIESERMSKSRETLQAMVTHLHATVADDTPNEMEILSLVNEVRNERAGHN